MKVIIADDEHLARRRIESLLAQFGDIEVVASLGDADAALKACEDMHPDLLLLDIRMPGLDGLEFARRLRESDARTQIVFCTAYEQHAVDAWEVRASDYLLKPVTPDRLGRALARVRELIGKAHRRAPGCTRACAARPCALRSRKCCICWPRTNTSPPTLPAAAASCWRTR